MLFNPLNKMQVQCFNGMENVLELFWIWPWQGRTNGAGAVIKSSLTQYQVQSNCPKLDCVVDVVALLRQTLSNGATATYASQAHYVSRVFWEIELGDVKREKIWDVKTIKNTRSMHSIFAYSEHDRTVLRTHSLSCFCSACKQKSGVDV